MKIYKLVVSALFETDADYSYIKYYKNKENAIKAFNKEIVDMTDVFGRTSGVTTVEETLKKVKESEFSICRYKKDTSFWLVSDHLSGEGEIKLYEIDDSELYED